MDITGTSSSDKLSNAFAALPLGKRDVSTGLGAKSVSKCFLYSRANVKLNYLVGMESDLSPLEVAPEFAQRRQKVDFVHQ